MPHTKDLINLKKVKSGSNLDHLIDKLNCNTNFGDTDPEDSIMHYGQLCNCDDGFLCKHRLQYIVDFIAKNFHG